MKTILTTVLLAAASTAFAQEATPDTWMSEARSTLSRAEVRAEAAAMLRNPDERALMAEGYLPTVAQSRLRAEVMADLQRARESGEFAAMSAEAHDFAPAMRDTAFASRSVYARSR